MTDRESRPSIVEVLACVALIAGLLFGSTGSVLADNGGETLEGLPTLGQAEMGDFRSKRFEERWHGVFIREPKPSKVGKTDLPKFGGDTARPFDRPFGGSSRSPFSGLRAPPSDTR